MHSERLYGSLSFRCEANVGGEGRRRGNGDSCGATEFVKSSSKQVHLTEL